MALEEELTYTLGKIKDVYDKQLKELFGIELVIPTFLPVIKLSELYEELENVMDILFPILKRRSYYRSRKTMQDLFNGKVWPRIFIYNRLLS